MITIGNQEQFNKTKIFCNNNENKIQFQNILNNNSKPTSYKV